MNKTGSKTENKARSNVDGRKGTTFVKEGSIYMDQKCHTEYIVRDLLGLSVFVLSQMPKRYGLEVDLDVFMSAFTHSLGNKRVPCSTWSNGPGWRYGVSQDALRRAQAERWRQHREELAQHAPSMVDSNKVAPLDLDDQDIADEVNLDASDIFVDGKLEVDSEDTFVLSNVVEEVGGLASDPNAMDRLASDPTAMDIDQTYDPSTEDLERRPASLMEDGDMWEFMVDIDESSAVVAEMMECGDNLGSIGDFNESQCSSPAGA